jgi:hypothetical protein
MKSILAALVALIFPLSPVPAATLVFYNGFPPNYDPNTNPPQYSNEVSILGNGIASATSITDADGTLVFPGPYPYFQASSFDDGNAFLFSFTIQPGFKASISEFYFDEVASAGGPTNWSVSINGITRGSGLTTDPTPSFTLALANLTGTVNIGIFATGATSSAATFTTGAFQIDGTTTPIPEPSTLAILAGVGLGLFLFRTIRRFPSANQA